MDGHAWLWCGLWWLVEEVFWLLHGRILGIGYCVVGSASLENNGRLVFVAILWGDCGVFWGRPYGQHVLVSDACDVVLVCSSGGGPSGLRPSVHQHE